MTVAIDRATGKRRGDRAPRPGLGRRLKHGYQTVLASAQPRPALPEYSSLWGPLDTELLKIAGDKESLDKGLSTAETAIAKLVPDFSK